MSTFDVDKSVKEVLAKIEAACSRSGRDVGSVQLVAISKNQDVGKMQAVAMAIRVAGVRVVFGENYVQEFELKRPSVMALCDEAHFTGTLQSNKAGAAVDLFDVIETIHSGKIAAAVSKECSKRNIRRKVLLQVNISGDSAKAGFSPAGLTEYLSVKQSALEFLDVEGLMTITAHYDDMASIRSDYRQLRELLDGFKFNPGIGPIFKKHNLSMGMSEDYEIAIEEGATHVRIGTALFGQR